MNSRTAWALQQAGVDFPQLLIDVRPSAGDICRRRVTRARADETFLTVYQLMMEQALRSISVTHGSDHVEGMIILRRFAYLRLAPGVFSLQGVVSRKQQLFPMISRLLSSRDLPTRAGQPVSGL